VIDPSSEALQREALRLTETGALAEAAALYARLLERTPELADGWYNLGLLQRRLRRYEDALHSYAQALARGVSTPEAVHLNRAVVYADFLHEPDAAEGELRAALGLNPDYSPALLNLANLYEDQGQRAAAIDLYAQVLAREPGHCEALARSANLHTFRTRDDPWISRLEKHLAAPEASAGERASLGFALGRALDECGDYEAAFSAYAAANRASRAAVTGVAAYDRDAAELQIERLLTAFPARPRRVVAPTGEPRPIFICGMFRSGSTLTEQMLAAHPLIAAGGELDLLPHLAQHELAPFPESMLQISVEALESLAGGYRKTLARLFPGAPCVTDKRPDNYLYIGLIKTLFPDARIVHTTRDPLDNCLSVYFAHLDPALRYAFDLLDIAHHLRQYRRLMAHWRLLYRDDILDVDYDALVREPRAALERLVRFCGLPWDERCLAGPRPGAIVKTASVWQVREPLHQRSSGRWRHYERHLAALRESLGDLGGPP
jgi:tetratricopeptide (TPR) repeat protein